MNMVLMDQEYSDVLNLKIKTILLIPYRFHFGHPFGHFILDILLDIILDV